MKKFLTSFLFALVLDGVLASLPLSAANGAAPATSTIPTYTYEVVHAYPHDPEAFIQGLFYLNGFLYESTGLNGHSSVRKVRLETGEVLRKVDISSEYFGEGLTYWGDRLINLTWTSHVGFVYGLNSFELQQRFSYAGEGWGITHDTRALIMSDGTSELRFLDPRTLEEEHRVRVTANGADVLRLNELEWVKGQIFANIWQTDTIARIDPATGHVVGWIDLSGILPISDRMRSHPDVLNGIAYDATTDRLFVTGKLWPKLFEIRLHRKTDSPPVPR